MSAPTASWPSADRHAQNHERNHEGCERVGVVQSSRSRIATPTHVAPSPASTASVAQMSEAEVEGVCGQRRRAGAAGHGAQLPRAPEIHADRGHQHQHRPQRVVQLHCVVKDPLYRLPDNPGTGNCHQPCFTEGRKILESCRGRTCDLRLPACRSHLRRSRLAPHRRGRVPSAPRRKARPVNPKAGPPRP